ncbi:hypothetical protein [Patiriisocius sp. Uisw_017]|uniref:hypothetical protein n=1 Tax=Patiriisocius sp. Uisw_017 TaxID=3230968 RepID=UPI0039EC7682
MELTPTITIIITTLVSISILAVLFTGISYLEKGKNKRKLFQDTKNLIYTTIILFVLVTILLLILELYFNIQMGSSLMYVIIGVIKIIIAFYVAREAKKQNRSYALWFILAFIEFHSALIALALGKTIYKVPNSSKLLFDELTDSAKEKVSSLRELTSSVRKSDNSIAIENEYGIPLMKIKREYSTEFNELLKNTKKQEHRNISLQKYERAYKAGIMDKEEYDSKIAKLTSE